MRPPKKDDRTLLPFLDQILRGPARSEKPLATRKGQQNFIEELSVPSRLPSLGSKTPTSRSSNQRSSDSSNKSEAERLVQERKLAVKRARAGAEFSPRESLFRRPSLPIKRPLFEENVIEEEESPRRPLAPQEAYAFPRRSERRASGQRVGSEGKPKDSDFYRDAEVIITEK